MNTHFEPLSFAGSAGPTRGTRRFTAAFLDLARRGVALTLIWLLLPLSLPLVASGQQAPPPPPPDQQQGPPPAYDQGPPPQAWTPLSYEQLDQLVAPIALYPDSLVAQVLAAATYPEQVGAADQFVQSNQGIPPAQLAQMSDNQPWDPSVKALTAFPSVLDNMNRNMDWTTQLGNAYYNQPQDVMAAVQSMRQEAYQRGDLRSTPQEYVNYAPGNIVIAPANPAVVYVPYYNPWAVWGFRPWYRWYAPPPPPGVVFAGGLALGFGFGVVIGAWSHWGWGWGHWGMGWGPHPCIVYNRVTYVSRSWTVINRGHYGYFDRGRDARVYNERFAHTYDAAYRRGAVAGYNRGFERGRQAGFSRGYNRGQANGYNHGYNQGVRNTYRAPVSNRPQARPHQNYNRPAQNYNRPAQNYNRPAQNYNRPAQNYNRPAQQYNRPQPQRQSRPQPQRQSRPQPQRQNRPQHNNDKPHGGGGDHGHGRR
jgi:hypothetical protein